MKQDTRRCATSAVETASPDVFVARDAIVTVGADGIDDLRGRLDAAPRGRVRLCAHPDAADRLHEMFIVMARHTYIRPHRHYGKAESLHVLEGSADAVFFEDDGRIAEVTPLGDYRSGRCFYYRIHDPRFHTLLIRSAVFAFHEVTTGPFDRAQTSFADWSPAEDNPDAVRAFVERLDAAVGARAGA